MIIVYIFVFKVQEDRKLFAQLVVSNLPLNVILCNREKNSINFCLLSVLICVWSLIIFAAYGTCVLDGLKNILEKCLFSHQTYLGPHSFRVLTVSYIHPTLHESVV